MSIEPDQTLRNIRVAPRPITGVAGKDEGNERAAEVVGAKQDAEAEMAREGEEGRQDIECDEEAEEDVDAENVVDRAKLKRTSRRLPPSRTKLPK